MQAANIYCMSSSACHFRDCSEGNSFNMFTKLEKLKGLTSAEINIQYFVILLNLYFCLWGGGRDPIQRREKSLHLQKQAPPLIIIKTTDISICNRFSAVPRNFITVHFIYLDKLFMGCFHLSNSDLTFKQNIVKMR